jgi:hypothetical protein
MSLKRFVIGSLALLSIAAGFPAAASAAAPTGVAEPSSNGCASRHNPYGLRLWIHVTKWCIVPGVRGQAQLKVQMRIHNRSDHRLDISRARVRVIVRHFDPAHWTPAQIGAPTPDRPVRTRFHGDVVWAVPANADGAYDVFPHKSEPTHATHWVRSQLGPKQTLNPHFHYGDLVFHLPIRRPRPHGWALIDDIVGIAFVKGRDIIALCPPDTWGEHAPAGTF